MIQRKQIESNLNNPNLEAIAYVDDKYDLFSLHIQGSGKDSIRKWKNYKCWLCSTKWFGLLEELELICWKKGYVSRNELSIQE